MKKKYFPAILLACVPCVSVASEQLSYSYIEAGYSQTDFDGFDADGYALKGSFAIGDSFYGAIGFHQDELEPIVTLEPWELTAGYRKDISANTDFIAEISYIGMNLEFFGDDYHNDGYRAAVGVRSAVHEHFELSAKAMFTSIQYMDSVVGVAIGAQYKFNGTWGIYADYQFNEYNFDNVDVNSFQAGVRASF